jgi:hypothetical protein
MVLGPGISTPLIVKSTMPDVDIVMIALCSVFRLSSFMKKGTVLPGATEAAKHIGIEINKKIIKKYFI